MGNTTKVKTDTISTYSKVRARKTARSLYRAGLWCITAKRASQRGRDMCWSLESGENLAYKEGGYTERGRGGSPRRKDIVFRI